MPFPDSQYLKNLLDHLEIKVKASQSDIDRALMLSSASMNWIADFLTDENALWTLEDIALDNLVLTGTNPEWNKVIIERAGRSPIELREILVNEPDALDGHHLKSLDDAHLKVPILVREEARYLKVLDGMHRTVAAIRDGRENIQAYVARIKGNARPSVEPHVVYDLLKAYHRGLNTDRQALVIALKYLRGAYSNVEDLLRNRFNYSWVPSNEIQEIIQEALRR